MHSNRKKILTGISISILFISIIFMTGCIEDEVNGQDEPEKTISTFVERINDEDGQGVMELGLTQFLDRDVFEEEAIPTSEEEFDEESDAFKSAIDKGELEVISYEVEEVRYLEDLDEENRTEFKELMDIIKDSDYFTPEVTDMAFINLEWDANIEDGSILEEYNMDELGNLGEEPEVDWDIFLLEINEEWYIPVPGNTLALILYMDLDTSEPSEFIGAIDAEFEEGRDGKEESNITVSFTSLTTPPSVELESLVIDIDCEDRVKIDETYLQDTAHWLWLNEDDEVVDGSELVVREEHEGITFPRDPTGVVISI